MKLEELGLGLWLGVGVGVGVEGSKGMNKVERAGRHWETLGDVGERT